MNTSDKKPSQFANKKQGTILTTWSLRTYDVWGNAKDGYEVNNTFGAGKVDLWIPKTVYNVGTPQEFTGAFPSDKQIRECFGLGRSVKLDIDGDDLHIYINRERDGYPVGEMYCESHESLSPIRKKEVA